MKKKPVEKTQRPLSRYALLAETLETAIRHGEYPVNSFLPPETKLQELYGVSRHTVRAALRRLHQLGLITSQRAIGTRIIAQIPLKPTLFSLDSFDNIVDAIYQNIPKILSCHPNVVLSAEMNQALEVPENKAWIEITLLRSTPTKARLPVMIDQFYIDAQYEGFCDFYDGKQSVIMLLFQHYNVQIVEMEQKIQAIQLDEHQADLLKEKINSPALKIRRYLYDKQKKLIAFSIKCCHAKHFTLTSHFRLAHPTESNKSSGF